MSNQITYGARFHSQNQESKLEDQQNFGVVCVAFLQSQHIAAAIFPRDFPLGYCGEVRVELMDMAHVVRVYDGYTGFFKAGLSRAADYVVKESDNAELKQHKIKLQTAFRMVIKDSQIFSIMVIRNARL